MPIAMPSFGGRDRARRDAAMAFAQANGLQFSERDTFGLFALPIELFTRTQRNACSNIVYGAWKGQNMWAFELQQRDVHGPDRFRCAATPLPTECPHIEVRRTTELWRMGNKLGVEGQDLSFESAEFNREFRVSTEDAKLGYDLVTEQMMAWLLGAPKEWRFAVSRNYAVAYRPMDGGDASFDAEPLDVMKGFWDHLPSVLASLYELKGPLIPVMGTGGIAGIPGDLGRLASEALGAAAAVGDVTEIEAGPGVTEVTIDPSGQVTVHRTDSDPPPSSP
jgi:hypothetical protein